MRSLRQTLIQCDWCPYRKRGFGHGGVHTGETMWRNLREDGPLRSEKDPGRSHRRNQPCCQVDLGLPASRTPDKFQLFMANRWGNNENRERLFSWVPKITADGDCSHEIKRHLLLGRKAMINLDSILKSRDITLPTKFHLVKATIFPVVMYRCESWIIRKAEHWRIDAFELWCWRRLLRVPWTARRSNLFILKEISPEYSLEGLMLKLKFQSFGHLMWRADSLEKTDPDAGKDWRQEEKRTAKDKMVGWHHWLDGHEFEQAPGVDDRQGSLACCSPWDHKELDTTEQLNWTETTHSVLWYFAAEALRNKYRQLWSSQSFVQNFLTVSSFFALSRLPSWGLSGTLGSEIDLPLLSSLLMHPPSMLQLRISPELWADFHAVDMSWDLLPLWPGTHTGCSLYGKHVCIPTLCPCHLQLLKPCLLLKSDLNTAFLIKPFALPNPRFGGTILSLACTAL